MKRLTLAILALTLLAAFPLSGCKATTTYSADDDNPPSQDLPINVMQGRFSLVDQEPNTAPTRHPIAYILRDVSTGNVYMYCEDAGGYRGYAGITLLWDGDKPMTVERYWATKEEILHIQLTEHDLKANE